MFFSIIFFKTYTQEILKDIKISLLILFRKNIIYISTVVFQTNLYKALDKGQIIVIRETKLPQKLYKFPERKSKFPSNLNKFLNREIKFREKKYFCQLQN